jgi:hypothetical protein
MPPRVTRPSQAKRQPTHDDRAGAHRSGGFKLHHTGPGVEQKPHRPHNHRPSRTGYHIEAGPVARLTTRVIYRNL